MQRFDGGLDAAKISDIYANWMALKRKKACGKNDP